MLCGEALHRPRVVRLCPTSNYAHVVCPMSYHQSPTLESSHERLTSWLDLQLLDVDDLRVAALDAVAFFQRVMEGT